MSQPAFVNDARVMAKGQVTIPKNVRAALGVDTGDRVTFIVDGNNVRVVNSTVYALMRFQEQMKGEAEKAGLFTEDDVTEWITQSRREDKFSKENDQVTPVENLEVTFHEKEKDKISITKVNPL
ncbi:MAG: AbrB/MazE/SpoVT family DNA-binding domain-containing protein, partial [Clostridia bacterium]|nr:AbrB/MazE/SpoVT family DNA-binding domain-containing protein [Clostridia bacterium]